MPQLSKCPGERLLVDVPAPGSDDQESQGRRAVSRRKVRRASCARLPCIGCPPIITCDLAPQMMQRTPTSTEKDAVRDYWNAAPCGTSDVHEVDEDRSFRELERQRDEREPFIGRFARFSEATGKSVLEVAGRAATP